MQVKGGSFTGDDKEFLRIKLGTGQVSWTPHVNGDWNTLARDKECLPLHATPDRVCFQRLQVIPAFEEALKTMKVGGVRRIIVPEEIGTALAALDGATGQHCLALPVPMRAIEY